MKSPIYVTQDSAGVSRWVPVDYKQTPMNIGIGVKLSAGANLIYTVEHTFDDIQDPAITPVAFPNSGLSGKTGNDDGNYAFAIKAIRLNVTTHTTGDATMMIVQGGV